VTDSFPTLPSTTQGLAFLDLGERLRQRGQLEAAATVALAGLSRYPAFADAHDLLARIRADQGEDAPAISAWHAALEIEPGHIGALKGLAFIAFRARDMVTAERHLEAAAALAPHDTTIIAALDRVRASAPSPSTEAFRLDELGSGLLLFDAQGMRLTGGIGPGTGETEADATAAEASGLAREAVRAVRFLGLGQWHQLVLEGNDARVAVIAIDDDATLLMRRPATTPPGRLLASSARAAEAARDWLGRSR
jgi:predicted regulator of Ras-like GTPase activity (Roadblock/LC7/MglB family)